MKRLAIILCLVIAALAMQAQKVNFYSSEFASGVREHLELGPTSHQPGVAESDGHHYRH